MCGPCYARCGFKTGGAMDYLSLPVGSSGQQQERVRSAEGSRGSKKEEVETRPRSHSDLTHKRRPPPIQTGDAVERVHIEGCLRKRACPGMPDDLKLRFSDDDPYIRLVAIRDGLVFMLKSARNKEAVLGWLAAALDRTPSDLLVIFDTLPKPGEEGVMYSPCIYLHDPAALLFTIQTYLWQSPRFVFAYFQSTFCDDMGELLPQSDDGDPPGEADAPDLVIPGTPEIPHDPTEFFFLRVLKATTCASFIDGWQVPIVREKFKAIWQLLGDDQKMRVRELVLSAEFMQPPDNDALITMGISS